MSSILEKLGRSRNRFTECFQSHRKPCYIAHALLGVGLVIFYFARIVKPSFSLIETVIFYSLMSVILFIGALHWLANATVHFTRRETHVFFLELLVFILAIAYCFFYIFIPIFMSVEGFFLSIVHFNLFCCVCLPYMFIITEKLGIEKKVAKPPGQIVFGCICFVFLLMFMTSVIFRPGFAELIYNTFKLGSATYGVLFCHEFLLIVLWRNFMMNFGLRVWCGNQSYSAINWDDGEQLAGQQTLEINASPQAPTTTLDEQKSPEDTKPTTASRVVEVNKPIVDQTTSLTATPVIYATKQRNVSDYLFEHTCFIVIAVIAVAVEIIRYSDLNRTFGINIGYIILSALGISTTFYAISVLNFSHVENKLQSPTFVPGIFTVVRYVLVLLEATVNFTFHHVAVQTLTMIAELFIGCFTFVQILCISIADFRHVELNNLGSLVWIRRCMILGLAISCVLAAKDMVTQFVHVVELVHKGKFVTIFKAVDFAIFFLDLEFRFAIIEKHVQILFDELPASM